MPLVVTRAQAIGGGRSATEVDALVRSGRWVALRRSVYLTQPELPVSPAARHAVLVTAAVLACGVPAVGSHASAAVVHGLPLLVPPPELPVLTRRRTAGLASSARRGARLVSAVPDGDVCTVLGAAITTFARTAVDLARTGSEVGAVVVLDAALRRVPRHELERVLDAAAGWPGSARARRRLAFADGLAESALESLGRLRLAQQGLPAPLLQVVVGGEAGPVGRVDYLWPEQRTVGEADGRLKYDDPGRLWAEKRREDALRDAGFEVFRFTWAEALNQPEVLRDRALRAFARAAARRAS